MLDYMYDVTSPLFTPSQGFRLKPETGDFACLSRATSPAALTAQLNFDHQSTQSDMAQSPAVHKFTPPTHFQIENPENQG